VAGVIAPVQKSAEAVEEPAPEEALAVEDAAPAKAYLALLQDALRGELYAQAYYQAAAEAFPGARRFQNLARAESRHAQAVGQAVQVLGGTPVSEHGGKIVAPATLADAESEGQKIERQVIERFEVLIRDCPDPAIKPILENLQAANYRHLRAMGG
jgi:rubrerythrin